MSDICCGQVVWVSFSPVIGSEQAGHRPALVIASDEYLSAVPNVVIVVPITTRDRGLPNHIELGGDTGLSAVSFAMTEQPRTIDRRRITSRVGLIDQESLREVRRCLSLFLGL